MCEHQAPVGIFTFTTKGIQWASYLDVDHVVVLHAQQSRSVRVLHRLAVKLKLDVRRPQPVHLRILGAHLM